MKPITIVAGFGRCGSSLVMQMLAAALTIRMALTTMHAEIRYRTLHVALLREISRQVTALKPIRELLSGIVKVTAQALEGYAVRLYEGSSGQLVLRATSIQDEASELLERPLPDGLRKSRVRCLDASWLEGAETEAPRSRPRRRPPGAAASRMARAWPPPPVVQST